MKIALFPDLLNINNAILQKNDWVGFNDLLAFSNYLRAKKTVAVIIPLTFKSSEKTWGDFAGISLIKLIRYELKLKIPIYVFSVLPRKTLKAKDLNGANKFDVLGTPGIHFASYPWDIKNLPKINQISDNALDDINFAFFNPKGNASEIVHNLKNKFGEIIKQSSVKNVFNNLREIIESDFKLFANEVLPDYRFKFQSIKNEMLDDLQNDIHVFLKQDNQTNIADYQNTPVIIDKYSDILYDLLPKELRDSDNTEIVQTPWQVLYIDDTEFCRNDVKVKFEKRGINCISVSSDKQAFEVLKHDKKGKISVIVSDVRLYKEDGDWQDLQGYDLLNEIHENHSNPLAYFVLTSKRGTIVDSVKRKAKFPIQWFSKSDVTTSEQGFNIFTQRVKELGGDKWFWKKSQPKLSAWTKESHRFSFPLSRYYRKHVELSDHEVAKNEIDGKAKLFIENYLKKKKNPEIEFLPTLKDDTVNEKMIEKFRLQILLGRRIIYALWLNTIDEENIFYALRPNAEYNKENRDLLFTSTMAVSFKNDLPDEKDINEGNLMGCNLLEEEIDFLIANYNLNPEIRSLRLNINDLDLVYEVIDSFRAKIESFRVEVPKDINIFIDKYFEEKLISFHEIEKAFKSAVKIAKDKNSFPEFRKVVIQKLDTLQSPKVMALFEKHF